MLRIDRLRAILLILVASTVFLSANFFLKSRHSSKEVGRQADKGRHTGVMLRIDRLRAILLILVASTVFLSANFFLKSRHSSKEVGRQADKGRHTGAHREEKHVTETSSRPDLAGKFVTEATLNKHNLTSFRYNETAYTSNATDYVATNTVPDDTDGGKYCPKNPPYLDFEEGGRLRPKSCVPRQRLAFIIPYRNRYEHLHILINNVVPILQRQQADVTFFIIEQALSDTFNRGVLLNVGFLEANKLGEFDCFIFHDVDLIPLNDRNLYRCGDHPRHFAVSMNKFGYQLAYKGYFGGVVGFSKKQYQIVNGCSNLYFGWGGEDDDLLSRLRHKNYTMMRYDALIARYDMIKHHRDMGNEDNLFRLALLRDALRRQDAEGLNTTKYTVNSIRIERLYTWITVSLNMTEILQTAPDLTLNLVKTQVARHTETTTIKKNIQKTVKRKQIPSLRNVQLHLTISFVPPKSLESLFFDD